MGWNLYGQDAKTWITFTAKFKLKMQGGGGGRINL